MKKTAKIMAEQNDITEASKELICLHVFFFFLIYIYIYKD